LADLNVLVSVGPTAQCPSATQVTIGPQYKITIHQWCSSAKYAARCGRSIRDRTHAAQLQYHKKLAIRLKNNDGEMHERAGFNIPPDT